MKAIYGFPKKSDYEVAIRCSLPSEFVIKLVGHSANDKRELRPEIDKWIDENVQHPCGFHYLPAYFRDGSESHYVIWFTNDVEGVMFRMTWL